MNHSRGAQYPALIFSVDNKPIEMEMPFPIHSDEGWHLYALLRAARQVTFLAEQVLPLLRVASLLEPNEHVEALEKVLRDIPRAAKTAQNQFYVQRSFDQQRLHDPKNPRQRPYSSLFKL